MKVAFVAVGVERGKQVVLVLSSGSSSSPSEPGAVARSTNAMHIAVRAFTKRSFSSYLSLGKLGLADLRQLCFEEEDDVPDDAIEGDV